MQRLVSALAAAVLAVPCAGQTSSTITEAEFLSALDDQHPALVAKREAVFAAEAELRRVAAWSNPRLTAVREDPTGSTSQIDLTLAWQPPHPSRRLAVSAGEKDLEAAQARYDSDRLDLRLSMREVYAQWAVATELAAAVGDQALAVDRLAQRQRRRAEIGESSGLEAARLELEAAQLSSRQALFETDALQSEAIARGFSLEIDAGARPELPSLPALVDVEGDHPTLEALARELEAARLASRVERRYIDLPEIIAGWQKIDLGEETLDGPVVGLSWQLPVVNRNRPERALADARVDAADARLQAAERQIGAERRGALLVYERLAQATADARRANSNNEQILEASMAAFQAGESSLTDLLDTVRAISEAESTALQLHGAALEAHRRVERTLGRGLDLE